jgi:hypothetical protein
MMREILFSEVQGKNHGRWSFLDLNHKKGWLFSLLFVVIIISVFPQKLWAESSCINSIKWSGSRDNIAVIKEALHGGILATLSSDRCKGVEMLVHYVNEKWSIKIHRKGNSTSHKGSSIKVVTTWIESLLIPPMNIKIISNPTHKNSKTVPKVAVTPTATVLTKSIVFPLAVDFFAGGLFSTNFNGAGGDVEIDIGVLKVFWAGLGAGYSAISQEGYISSQAISFQLVAGGKLIKNRFAIMPGFGVGLFSTDITNYNKEFENTPLTASRVDMAISLFLRVSYALTQRLRLLVEMSVQYKFANLSMSAPHVEESETSENNDKSFLLKDAGDSIDGAFSLDSTVFMVRVGVSWGMGGWR